MNKADDFFTPGERERIRAAVAESERGTSGEIATMVVDASDSYREADILGAMLLSGLLSVIVAVAVHHVTIWSYIPLVVLFYFPCRYLFRLVPRLKLPFAGRLRLAETVRERAVRAFYEKGLYRTRGETGILIFISLLEHKVWILGDRGINEKISPDFWRKLASELADGLRQGRACDALVAVISACGVELAAHFPPRPDDVNELRDEILTDSSSSP
ncbi:TPM domain-containing protein [Geobacter benzoatilyticus]|uniref:TPM domain-containing protein n=1 Tax=Geobacter benzoatilyticus TaxID=2815309 RepID=A0ABX7Q0H5_9BACT|nr:TPM domain-containing protein [Geobacter benzoatilyticus]QSV44894.1 TPM domain-containing protein [Geobacter benzoatilyticus]